jgi:hypothetical protein
MTCNHTTGGGKTHLSRSYSGFVVFEPVVGERVVGERVVGGQRFSRLRFCLVSM